jgi:hypothetical protein
MPIKVEWYKGEGGLSEIYQQVGMYFALMSAPRNGSKQCHQFFKCRDFLQDAVRAHLVKGTVSIYGFSHKYGTNPPVDMARTRLLVTDKESTAKDKAKWRKYMKRALEMIHIYEDLAGVSKSKLYFVGEGRYPNTWLFNGPAMWMKSPFLISMYSFLIRLGVKDIKTTSIDTIEASFKKLIAAADAGKINNDNDMTYLKNAAAYKMRLVAKHWRKLFVPKQAKYDDCYTNIKRVSRQTFHDRTGIQSLTSGCSGCSLVKKRFQEVTKK